MSAEDDPESGENNNWLKLPGHSIPLLANHKMTYIIDWFWGYDSLCSWWIKLPKM